MTTPLSLDTARREDGAVALVAAGEIDLSNVASFASALTAALGQTVADTSVIVDLSGVEYLDSGAINVLFNSAERIRVIANPLLLPVLKVSGLADLTSVTPPEED